VQNQMTFTVISVIVEAELICYAVS